MDLRAVRNSGAGAQRGYPEPGPNKTRSLRERNKERLHECLREQL